MYRGVFICVALALGLCSCAAKTQNGQQSTALQSDKQYELVTIEQQAKESVLGSPTEFRIPLVEDSAAWARAELFFRQYTESGPERIKPLGGGGIQITNNNSRQDRYTYSVEKYNSGTKITYMVDCRANSGLGGEQRFCRANAQNLARFIREGQLELSLLSR